MKLEAKSALHALIYTGDKLAEEMGHYIGARTTTDELNAAIEDFIEAVEALKEAYAEAYAGEDD